MTSKVTKDKIVSVQKWLKNRGSAQSDMVEIELGG